MKNQNINKVDNDKIILYVAQDGQTRIEVKLEDETVWLSQAQIADLFQKTVPTINEHIKNIFFEGELEKISTIRKFLIVQKEGNRDISREVDFYNLDVIISVGYRVSSHRGTQFRIWATQKLREYIVKGFVMDDERLENGGVRNGFFKEWLERVRKIRASERNLYEKVRDTFATSIDYDSRSDHAKEFYASVQNKFHYAITGATAAEIIVNRIDSKKENLGLTNWRGESPTRKDMETAKNYMIETELRQLYLLVEQFLAYAEFQIERKNPMYMKNWKTKLDEFLKLNELEILSNKGGISHEEMEKKVKKELKRFLSKNNKTLK
jgi:hypothetical protein